MTLASKINLGNRVLPISGVRFRRWRSPALSSGSSRGSAGTTASAQGKRERDEEEKKGGEGCDESCTNESHGRLQNSSSSSSESSNNECGEVVDKSCLRSGALA
ncbi:hypothetical protein AAC387_Pa04g1867 [Persea americana]